MSQATAQVFPTGSGGGVNALSHDGGTVLMQAGAFWTPGTGFVGLSLPAAYNSWVVALSADGSLIAGNSGNAPLVSNNAYFIDKSSNASELPQTPNPRPDPTLWAVAISGDGSTMATYDQDNSNLYNSRTYSSSTGYTTILSSSDSNSPEVLSNNGQAVAGTISYGSNQYAVWYKPSGGSAAAIVSGYFGAYATAMSPDGNTVWGYYYDSGSNEIGFRWTASSFITIPNFMPMSATDDGFVAVGLSERTFKGEIYMAGGAPEDLNQFLSANGLNEGSYVLNQTYISGDGTHLVTYGTGSTNVGIYVTLPGFAMHANDDSYTLPGNVLSTVNAAQGVLANDVNVYSGQAEIVANPTYAASFSLQSNGAFTYQPTSGFSGTDTFTYHIVRDGATSNTATVTINIQSATQISVLERLGLGHVPDGTKVTINNNDGTPLSPPQSATTVGGVVSFGTLPAPASPNTSYEIVCSVPTSGVGVAATVHNYGGGSQTVYLTPVRVFVTQTLTSAAPVAFASIALDGFHSTTATSGLGGTVWLPDGTYTGTVTMNPGIPGTLNATLGASSSANLTASGGFANLGVHMTQITLTARTTIGGTYLPKPGTWTITPGGLTDTVNGQVTSTPWWLPDGPYTGAMSASAKNGSTAFTIGPPITQGVITVIVS